MAKPPLVPFVAGVWREADGVVELAGREVVVAAEVFNGAREVALEPCVRWGILVGIDVDVRVGTERGRDLLL